MNKWICRLFLRFQQIVYAICVIMLVFPWILGAPDPMEYKFMNKWMDKLIKLEK
jgi:hypothetical protein